MMVVVVALFVIVIACLDLELYLDWEIVDFMGELFNRNKSTKETMKFVHKGPQSTQVYKDRVPDLSYEIGIVLLLFF